MKFIKARWFTPSDFREIKWIVMHTMESPESANTAENVANWFAGLPASRKVSAHYNIDCDSIVQCVRDKDVAYAAPNANRHGLHIELAGRAAQLATDWKDAFSKAQLSLAADLVATKCRENGIPPVWLTPAELKAGRKGICGHSDCTAAFGGSHTDPGKQFPREEFITMVRANLEPAHNKETIEAGMGLLRALFALPLPPSTRAKLNDLRDDQFWPPRT